VEVQDLDALVQAMKQLPSDINASPSCANSAAKRMLHTLQPKLPFRLMHDAKSVMESIIEEEEKIKDTTTPTETKNRERKAALMSQ
jgi:hypothetical protein